MEKSVSSPSDKEAPDPESKDDIEALAKGGRTNVFGFLLRLAARLPFLFIGCGVVEGAGLGQNARASLIGRGFAEMLRYGKARGAKEETLSGLCGLGDLVLTCSSESSRNFSLGMGLGKGVLATELLSDRATVAEGAFTAPVVQEDARARDVPMPITDAVCALLAGETNAKSVVGELMNRPLVSERR